MHRRWKLNAIVIAKPIYEEIKKRKQFERSPNERKRKILKIFNTADPWIRGKLTSSSQQNTFSTANFLSYIQMYFIGLPNIPMTLFVQPNFISWMVRKSDNFTSKCCHFQVVLFDNGMFILSMAKNVTYIIYYLYYPGERADIQLLYITPVLKQ